MYNLIEEPLFVKDLNNGSVKAFDILYNHYSPKLYHFVMTISDSNRYLSEEIVQSVFIKIWEKREQINSEKSFISYLFTMARNLLLNNYQHELVKFVYSEYVLKNNSELVNEKIEENLNYSQLLAFIDSIVENLPPGRKQVYILSKKEQLSNKEIGVLLNISESTVEKQLSSALKYVKQQLLLHYDKISIILFISMF